MTITGDVTSGPLILAIPIAALAGAVTILSPCCLPLIPGYLAYVTGMSGASLQTGDPGVNAHARRGRTLAGAALFVLGFSLLFASYGLAFGSIGSLLLLHRAGITRMLGIATVLLGLMLVGAFDRFSLAGRILKPSMRPRAGLVGAPLLGLMFGLGWTPCVGPTLQAVLLLGLSSGTALRGAFLAFVYALGVGIPLLVVALAAGRGVSVFGFARRHGRVITAMGGAMLIVLGLLEATGAWNTVTLWLQVPLAG